LMRSRVCKDAVSDLQTPACTAFCSRLPATPRYPAGGSIENRARLILEVIDAVAARVGPKRTSVKLQPGVTFSDLVEPEADVKEVGGRLEEGGPVGGWGGGGTGVGAQLWGRCVCAWVRDGGRSELGMVAPEADRHGGGWRGAGVLGDPCPHTQNHKTQEPLPRGTSITAHLHAARPFRLACPLPLWLRHALKGLTNSNDGRTLPARPLLAV
jgi:hypothetical protein